MARPIAAPMPTPSAIFSMAIPNAAPAVMPIPTQAPTLTLPCPAISELVDRAIVAAARVVESVNRAAVVVRPMALTTPIRRVRYFITSMVFHCALDSGRRLLPETGGGGSVDCWIGSVGGNRTNKHIVAKERNDQRRNRKKRPRLSLGP